ncbi:MAG: bacteriocin fulvocin C-related protein [Bacteroidales bacterium]|jgi:hypothetical protein|nr:bacteriocin fulvocin C-related protein [Bacteroidales bacterium]NCU37118.1 hypothetical protein [Candidatus Falkowbacteria bacterium]MDD2632788.1 bacteriocin fulvocin C-related protein [Bacteroidales bacterium]MDD3131743.1 bacteriocin fulvocin C-related protein [Bacteroidales bacterium]MDD3527866.1 bacteriocin fulvocin C-related protein [Bacteroidales bacterium]
MKSKIPKLLILMFTFIIALSGCKKDSEVKTYSCNSEVDSWVKSNLSKIKSMERLDILNYPSIYQKGIFRASTPEKRLIFWQEKLDEVLSLEWFEYERLHILMLKSEIGINWFDESLSPNAKEDKIIFMSEWLKFGMEELRWSKALIHSMLVVLETNKSDNGFLMESVRIQTDKNFKVDPYYGDCECGQSDDWCDIPGTGGDLAYCKEDNDCSASSLGCGTLWLSPCDGMCELGMANPG